MFFFVSNAETVQPFSEYVEDLKTNTNFLIQLWINYHDIFNNILTTNNYYYGFNNAFQIRVRSKNELIRSPRIDPKSFSFRLETKFRKIKKIKYLKVY
ncbi:hypothetical protein HZS_7030, partial [Henneguya salminicola]